MSEAIFCDYLVNELEEKILKVGPELVAAFIAEPILASGGVIVPPTDYHRRCLEVCRRYDVLYISDEVVTGFGRLGHWFASKEVFDIIPDIITTAKGITSSYAPLGAVLISEKLIDEVEKCENGAIFANGFTYSGHPIACAAALANINIINDDKLLEHARDVGPYFQKRLRELKELPMVGDARGVGLMGCIECVINKETDQLLEVDYDIGKRIDTHCQSLGLLVRPLVNMCVISPPIIITRGDIDKVVNILRTGIERTMADLQREGIALFNW
jgi:adenosylmethionine-8-amino-7-oxononanoate aminotransferase